MTMLGSAHPTRRSSMASAAATSERRRGFRHAEPKEKLASGLGVAWPEQARAFGETAHDPCA